jgi:inosine-uridine nucleoside N-ribohydrolase
MSDRPAVILDCDPGQDDAVAMVLAGRHTELLGITTVSGNVALELTTRNALMMAQVLELDVPVHAGADRPLIAEPRHAEQVHGETGLDGPRFPALARDVAPGHAVEFLIETVRTNPGCWLVPTGPLTNLALAFRLAPDMPGLVAGVSFMGGSATGGNVTPSAEFNIWCDPEAAMVVIESGARLVMAGLHVTHQVRADRARIAAIREVGTAAGIVVADLLDFYGSRYAERLGDDLGAPLHDPVAVAAVTHPHLLEFESYPVTISRSGPTRGMTIVDRRPQAADGPRVELAMRADADGFFALLTGTVATYP